MPPRGELTALEKTILEAFRSGGPDPLEASSDGWVAWGLRTVLEASRMLRAGRRAMSADSIELKADGSPATRVEHEVEAMLRERLSTFEPEAVVVGEETGGELAARGWTVAVDPVDGTWAFLNGMETYASTLAVLEDGRPVVGFVANPTTGHVAYSGPGVPARLLKISTFGEPDASGKLPYERELDGPVLVNVHPGRGGGAVVAALYDAWGRDTIRMVRSAGGSPAWAVVEAARGRFVYVNLWSRRAAEPFDLAAPNLVLRGAGGEMCDLDGHAVDVLTHAAPFVAAVRRDRLERVSAIVRAALR